MMKLMSNYNLKLNNDEFDKEKKTEEKEKKRHSEEEPD